MTDTVLILRNEETRGLVGMPEAIRLMEEAYADLGNNRAQVLNREWLNVPLAGREVSSHFLLNVIPGAVPCHNVAAIRLSARHASFSLPGEARPKAQPGGNSGFVLVWELNTRKLLGIVQDDAISPLRVGATSALAAKYLCRPDVRTAGMIGAGRQAVGQITGLLTIRPSIEEVKVYSLRSERRERFAAWVAQRFGIKTRAVESTEKCVRESDVVFTATSATDPVVKGAWLEEGMHLCGMLGTPRFDTRREMDDEVGRRADIVTVNSIDQARHDLQAEILDPIRKGYLTWDRVNELSDLGGLEVRNVAGEWIGATPIRGTLVINLGDLMQRWTNDLYRSNMHRVKNNRSAGRNRHSIAFFHSPRPTARIECLPTCTDAEHPPKFAPCTAGEHRAEMFKRSYGFAPTS